MQFGLYLARLPEWQSDRKRYMYRLTDLNGPSASVLHGAQILIRATTACGMTFNYVLSGCVIESDYRKGRQREVEQMVALVYARPEGIVLNNID